MSVSLTDVEMSMVSCAQSSKIVIQAADMNLKEVEDITLNDFHVRLAGKRKHFKNRAHM